MAFDVSQKQGCICYDNRMTPTYVSSIALTNITADAGFPANNLAYDDPTMVFKTSATNASDRFIDITFTAPVTVNCVGFVNHDVITNGYTLTVSVWNGSSFILVATQAMSGTLNPNFFARFPQISNATIIRIQLGLPSGTRPAFQIGMLFLGKFYEFEKNPTDGGIFYSQTVDNEPVPALGGTVYYRPGAARVTEHAELSWPRINASMMLALQTLFWPNKDKVVGLIWPEEVSFFLPNGTPHLFGRFESLTPSPRMAESPPHKYDLTMTLKGLS